MSCSTRVSPRAWASRCCACTSPALPLRIILSLIEAGSSAYCVASAKPCARALAPSSLRSLRHVAPVEGRWGERGQGSSHGEVQGGAGQIQDAAGPADHRLHLVHGLLGAGTGGARRVDGSLQRRGERRRGGGGVRAAPDEQLRQRLHELAVRAGRPPAVVRQEGRDRRHQRSGGRRARGARPGRALLLWHGATFARALVTLGLICPHEA